MTNMNILTQIENLTNPTERAVATVVGQRGGGQVVAETTGGATVLLHGDIETGKKCFYDRRSGRILGEAPYVEFGEYGI